MSEFATTEDFAKLMLERYKEISRKFEEYLNTVPEEYREAFVQEHLNQLVEHGWLRHHKWSKEEALECIRAHKLEK